MLNFQRPFSRGAQCQRAVPTEPGRPARVRQFGPDNRTPIRFQPRQSTASLAGDRAADPRHRIAERAQPGPALALGSGPGYCAALVFRFHD